MFLKYKRTIMSGETLFFIYLFFNSSATALKYCVVFCCTMWIGYRYTYMTSLLSLPPTLPSSPGHHRALSWAPCAKQQVPPSPLPSYFTHASAYMSVLLSQSVPPLLPLLCPQVHSACLQLYSCPADRFISAIFLDSICMH